MKSKADKFIPMGNLLELVLWGSGITIMYQRKIPIELNCGLDLVREVLYGKWKIHLLYFISQGDKRPGELQRKIPGATRRVLSVQLNQLEEHELISKKIYAELPPKVEYSLTALGESVLPVIMTLGEWGDDHQEQLRTVIAKTYEGMNR
jgi:DNA-binding HxlR family transcriptional regulator